mgnify:FL=1
MVKNKKPAKSLVENSLNLRYWKNSMVISNTTHKDTNCVPYSTIVLHFWDLKKHSHTASI